MSATPKWTIDLVREIQKWEDDGHTLTPKAGIEEVKAACHSDWLKMVPPDVKNAAYAISEYLDQMGGEL